MFHLKNGTIFQGMHRMRFKLLIVTLVATVICLSVYVACIRLYLYLTDTPYATCNTHTTETCRNILLCQIHWAASLNFFHLWIFGVFSEVVYVQSLCASANVMQLSEAHWPICYDYAVKDGCYKRNPDSGKETPKDGYSAHATCSLNLCPKHARCLFHPLFSATSMLGLTTCRYSWMSRLSTSNCYYSEPWTGTRMCW